MKILLPLFAVMLFGFAVPTVLMAQEYPHSDEYEATWRAEVVEVISEEERVIPGTTNSYLLQIIVARIIDGPRAGEEVTIENDYLELAERDKFYFNYLRSSDGAEIYNVINLDRRGGLLFVVALFAGAVIALGGWQGLRSLVSLVVSFGVIFYILLPGIMSGWDPILASFIVAALILFAAIFFTHGWNRESAVAYGGTMLAVIFTAILAAIAVHVTSLSGFATDESVYLDFGTEGRLNFSALLLGAIIIGVLGVLDDIAVTQAAVVTELYGSNPGMSRREAYGRALRIGREHVGALVNTLVLAYVGVSLPLLLYFHLSPAGFGATVNLEIFATEIVRAAVGSIGLIATVPIVTALAARFLKGYKPRGKGHVHTHHSSSGDLR